MYFIYVYLYTCTWPHSLRNKRGVCVHVVTVADGWARLCSYIHLYLPHMYAGFRYDRAVLCDEWAEREIESRKRTVTRQWVLKGFANEWETSLAAWSCYESAVVCMRMVSIPPCTSISRSKHFLVHVKRLLAELCPPGAPNSSRG